MPAPKVKLTTQSRAYLFVLAKNAGLDNAALHGEIKARYGIDSIKDLTPSSYQGLIRLLKHRAARLARIPDRSAA